jgi:chaperone required for assembly of F1-ATPase
MSSENDLKTDSVAGVRRGNERPLPKRFYKLVDISIDGPDRFLTLDGRRARTPAGKPLAVASEAIAAALAAEWDAQAEHINSATMPVTRMINAALDRVSGEMDEVRKEIVRYAGNDLVCYRAEEPDELRDRQEAIWGPVTGWAGREFGVSFRLASGVIAIAQPPEVAGAVAEALKALDPLPLTGLHTVTTLTGSALLALGLLAGELSPDETWSAAYVDEDWQMEKWGRDDVALALRAGRRAEFDAANLIMGEH